MLKRLAMSGAAALALAACSPTLDWREVRAADGFFAALFPCRPSSQSRTVRLVGKGVRLSLQACSAAGVTWALAVADVEDPALVSAALGELLQAAQANIGGVASQAVAAKVPGATPNPASVRAEIAGQLPDGQAVVEHVAVFAHATKVVQVTALGQAVAVEALATFFDSVRVVP